MYKSTIDRELSRLEDELFDLNNHSDVLLTLEWAQSMADKPGVYGWFENNYLIYIGETGKLCERINDARTTEHHSLRRSLGNERLKGYKYFKHVTAKDRFTPILEARLDSIMKALKICVLPIDFGRKEFEEYIINQHGPIYNHKGQRG